MINKVNKLDLPIQQKKLFSQLYYLFIFIFIAFLLSIFTTDVFAIDSGYYQSTYDTHYYICYGASNCTTQSENTGFISLGTNNDLPQGSYTSRIQIRTLAGATSNTWYKNNTYTFRYTFNLSYLQFSNDEIIKNFKVDGLYANTSSSNVGSTSSLIDSFTYRWEDGSVEGRYLLYVTFIPNEDIKYLSINLYAPNYQPDNMSQWIDKNSFTGSLTYSYLKVTYTEGANALIEYQTQVIQDMSDKINQNLEDMMSIFQQSNDEINDTITDSDISEGQGQANDFFNDFTTDTYGLTSVITAPLSFFNNLTSSSCSPLVVPLPFIDTDLTLPCMSTIYSQYFGSFFTLYQSITFGVIAYWVVVRIFNLVKDFKNPEHDEIEVFDL